MDRFLNELLDRVFHPAALHSTELPGIDLYMDQIMTLIEESYGPGKRRQEDKLLTKTMIHNYSKEGLIKPSKGKKYTREHILQMLMILSLKNALSIGEIGQVFHHLYQDPQFDGKALEQCYEQALLRRDEEMRFWYDQLHSRWENEQMETSEEQLVMLFLMVSLSQAFASAAEGMVDLWFSKGKNTDDKVKQEERK